ncbi:hypothetical protein NDU88_003459 [Pleurodeles waltl]|uniref:Uncharacterized protein n=1 Tax=Pleurodeles waltl TaxID=8319 RepID=A0AAV7L625_PLEWA|nr:hypothetical protein NDU88_003459 [Pleurodeles waltl]
MLVIGRRGYTEQQDGRSLEGSAGRLSKSGKIYPKRRPRLRGTKLNICNGQRSPGAADAVRIETPEAERARACPMRCWS